MNQPPRPPSKSIEVRAHQRTVRKPAVWTEKHEQLWREVRSMRRVRVKCGREEV